MLIGKQVDKRAIKAPEALPSPRRWRLSNGRQAEADGLSKVYQKDPQSGAYLIEVALDEYENLFNEWDPAPFKHRDIDPDLQSYLEACAEDIPSRYDVILSFSVPRGRADEAKEKHVRAGLANAFALEMRVIQQNFHRLYRVTLAYLVIALALLTLTAYSRHYPGANLALDVLREGITIGAWVFTWETISFFFFRRYEIRRDERVWSRFRKAPFVFTYRDETSTGG